jgi:hypothetical protein
VNAINFSDLDDDDLVDRETACEFLGSIARGIRKPLHPVTFWRGTRSGRYPAPIEVSASIRRWRLGDLREAKRRMIEASRTATAARNTSPAE